MWSEDEDSLIDNSNDSSLFFPRQLLPPALELLPRQVINAEPMALLPLLPLPLFQGVTPQFQPLEDLREQSIARTLQGWLGQVFKNVIYKRFANVAYRKIDSDENWNLWLCDLSKLIPNTSPACPQEQEEGLSFESRFEGGNLSAVSRLSPNQFNLLLQNDTNSKGHSQWFFFKVTSRGSQRAKFNLLNNCKSESLFRQGMRPSVYSKVKFEKEGIGWHRAGENIEYYRNGYYLFKEQPLYTLSFEYQFQSQDEVYFAYGFPYNYSDLMNFLARVPLEDSSRHLKRTLLCKSLAQNRVELLTITDPGTSFKFKKMGVVLVARVHPGEAVSSFMIAGIIKFLISSHPTAVKLREYFVFKVFPMLNPDGVIHGNSRCSIAGVDPNKHWKSPDPSTLPEIYHAKKTIFEFAKEHELVFCADFHGHSLRKNMFCYGCHDSSYPSSTRQFPYLLSKLVKWFKYEDSGFSYPDSQFGLRSILWKSLKVSNVLTIQISNCGPEQERNHFTPQNFDKFGAEFCETVLIYFRNEVRNRHLKAALDDKANFQNLHQKSKQEQLRENYLAQFYKRTMSEGNETNSEESRALSERKLTVGELVHKRYQWLMVHQHSVDTASLGNRSLQHSNVRSMHKLDELGSTKNFVIREKRSSVVELKGRVQQKQKTTRQEKKVILKVPTKCINPMINLGKKVQTKQELLYSSKTAFNEIKGRQTPTPTPAFRSRVVSRSEGKGPGQNQYERVLQILKKK